MNRKGRAPGRLVISLDFELAWGVRDRPDYAGYLPNLLGARLAVPRLLSLFGDHGVRATWATVGFLFCETRDELAASAPEQLPSYDQRDLSPFTSLEEIGANEEEDPVHYAPSLVKLIDETPGQEVGTHTFSHYYCCERGQTESQFRADLRAAQAIAVKKLGHRLTSIVFPRNQISESHLRVCAEEGLLCYRGVQAGWMYSASEHKADGRLRRAARLAEAYVHVPARRRSASSDHGLADVPASRFLRPFAPKLRHLDGRRLRRIQAEMTAAALRGATYHLWWHPHNFGSYLEENLQLLRELLAHFDSLRRDGLMVSLTMGEAALNAQQGE